MTIQYYLFNSQLTLVDHLNEYQTARIILSSHFRCYFDPHPYLPFKDGMCNSRNSQDKGGTYSVFTFNRDDNPKGSFISAAFAACASSGKL